MSSNNLIMGKVINKDGNPIVNAVVLVNKGPDPHQDIAILTNDKGQFDLQDLETGEYELLIRKKEYLPKIVKAKTISLSETQLIIEMKEKE